MTIDVKLDTKVMDELIRMTPENADKALRATAFQVEGIAKGGSPVLTGANRNSIYTKTSKGNHGTPGDMGDILPNVSQGEAVVGPSMEYSAFLEFGTSRMAPRPYLTPAAEQAPALFEENIKKVMPQK
jgi:HK97 gp10 family phage protein